MSEKLSLVEQRDSAENASEGLEKAHNEQLERARAEAQAAQPEKTAEALQALENQAETKARSATETTVEQVDTGPAGDLTLLGTQKELKQQAYDRKMKQIQGQLSAPERSFSKLVHQPLINNASEAAGKTLFRPSGVLGGSLAALFGSAVLLYVARHYGFHYNYLVFFLLFAAGFVFGLMAELIIRLVRHRS